MPAKRRTAGPSLFAEDVPEPAGQADTAPAPARPPERQPGPFLPPPAAASPAQVALDEPAQVFKLSPQEKAAAAVSIPERSLWLLQGEGVVEIRGTSPLVVWFSKPSAPALAQMTLYRHVFLSKAKRQ
jgi:hypothetical protein